MCSVKWLLIINSNPPSRLPAWETLPLPQQGRHARGAEDHQQEHFDPHAKFGAENERGQIPGREGRVMGMSQQDVAPVDVGVPERKLVIAEHGQTRRQAAEGELVPIAPPADHDHGCMVPVQPAEQRGAVQHR